MSTDAPKKYPADKALKAMGNTSRRWENHLDMGKIFAPPKVNLFTPQGPGRGKMRQLPLDTIVQGAIAFALIDCGVGVREAYCAGAQFAFLGKIEGPFAQNEAAPLDPVLDRMAGRLFARGETWLIWSVGDLEPHETRLAIISDANPAFIASDGISGPSAIANAVGGDSAAPRILLNLTEICHKIAASLAINFTAVFVTKVV